MFRGSNSIIRKKQGMRPHFLGCLEYEIRIGEISKPNDPTHQPAKQHKLNDPHTPPTTPPPKQTTSYVISNPHHSFPTPKNAYLQQLPIE